MDQELFDTGPESLVGDGAVEQAGRVHTVVAESREELCGLPGIPPRFRRAADRSGDAL